MRRSTILAAGTVSLLMAVACSGGDDATATPIPPTAAAVAATIAPAPTARPTAAPEPSPTATPAPTSTTAATATAAPAAPQFIVYPVSMVPESLAFDGEDLWIGGTDGGFLQKLGRDGESLGSFRGAKESVTDLIVAGGAVWVSDFKGGQVWKLGLDGSELGRFDVRSPGELAFDGEALWVLNNDQGSVTKLAQDGTELGRFEATGFPRGIVFDGEVIWVTDRVNDTVTRLSLDGSKIGTRELFGYGPEEMVFDGEHVWLINLDTHIVTKLARDGSAAGEFALGQPTIEIAFDGEAIWTVHQIREGTRGNVVDGVVKLALDGTYLGMLDLGAQAAGGIISDGENVWVGLSRREVVKVPTDIFATLAAAEPPPYREEEVTFQSGDLTFAGTLTLPQGEGPHPAAVLVTGAGPDDRDAVIYGFRMFKDLANHLTRNGIAILRVDDRQIGGSTGDFDNHLVEEEVGDMLAAVQFLTSHPNVNSSQIGLVGHGLGGMIVPLAANQSDDVAFVISMGAGAPSVADVLREQVPLWLGVEGENEAYIQRMLEEQEKYFRAILTGEGIAELEDAVERGAVLKVTALKLEKELYVTPYFKSMVQFDQGPESEHLTTPILALLGEKDVVVPVDSSIGEFTRQFELAGNPDFTVTTVPGANHFFQAAQTGGPTEQPRLEPEFAPGFLDLISDWIVERVDVAS